jgi:autotransporter strand-loop-strand O-heptosyltransferase
MKIIQVTPGNIPIPPNGWGAVEKVIWEYKLGLDKIGWSTEIRYTDEVDISSEQIVHVHIANLANILNERSIPYVFSLHDHHVEYFGKDSQVYRDNYQAIKNSVLTFVHAPHLKSYFDNLENIVYLQHGVNLNDYGFSDRSSDIRAGHIKLLMMANNGIGGDNMIDRKGFLLGIEAARKLGLPIDIMCPSSNKPFFNHWKVDYEGLNILYDVDYKESLERMKDYNLFLHPSSLEAGHPNLTLLESISSGIPVVGTCDVDFPGLVRCQTTVDSVVDCIKAAISKYDSLICDIKSNRINFSWDLVVSRMLQNYKKFFNISEKYQLDLNYRLVRAQSDSFRVDNPGIIVNFQQRKVFCKVSFSADYTVIFKDSRTNSIIYHGQTNGVTRIWFSAFSSDVFRDWLVEVKQGARIILSQKMDLTSKKVLLVIENFYPDEKIIKDFMDQTGCFLTIKSQKNPYSEHVQWDLVAREENFYYSLNEKEILSYFDDFEIKQEKTIIIVNTNAIGDKIVAIRYAQEWAHQQGKRVDLSISGSHLFDKKDFPNLNILENRQETFDDYSDLIYLDYKFDRPIQRGFSDQLLLEYKELRPVIKKSNKPRSIKSDYICLGVQSTSQCKYWNYPNGWEELSKMIRKSGLTPVSVDLHETFGTEGWWNTLPPSSVRKTGLDFEDVINIIQHCNFFVGVSSGLSWLAHALGKKVVMISGVTSTDNEFTQDIVRIQNKEVCNSCFTKTDLWKFDPGDWTWCPEHKESTKWFECTRTISPEYVFEQIKQHRLL